MNLKELLAEFQRCKKDAHTQGCLEVMNDVEKRLKQAVSAIKASEILVPPSRWDVLKKVLQEIEEPSTK